MAVQVSYLASNGAQTTAANTSRSKIVKSTEWTGLHTVGICFWLHSISAHFMSYLGDLFDLCGAHGDAVSALASYSIILLLIIIFLLQHRRLRSRRGIITDCKVVVSVGFPLKCEIKLSNFLIL